MSVTDVQAAGENSNGVPFDVNGKSLFAKGGKLDKANMKASV